MPKKIFDIFPPNNMPQEDLGLDKQEKRVEEIRRKPSKSRARKALFLFLSLIIILGVFAYFSLSQAEIEIYPEVKVFSLQEEILVDVNLSESDFSGKIFSGMIFEEKIELSKNFIVTGKTQKETPARGIIRIFNNHSVAQTLVKNTRLQSPLDDICFCLEKGAVIQPGKSLDCDVFSCTCAPPGGKVVGGEKYNIRASDFSIPGLSGTDRYMAVYGKSSKEMEGGFVGESLQVTKKDIEEAENNLIEEIKKQGVSLLKNKIPAEFIISEDVLDFEIIEKNFSAEVGDEVDNFDLQILVNLKALSFKNFEIEKFIREIIQIEFRDELLEESNFWLGEKIQEESLKVDYFFKSADWEEGKISLNLDASANVYPEISEIFVKSLVSGKSKKEVLVILSNQPRVQKVNVNLWPFWVNSISKNGENINIKLEL